MAVSFESSTRFDDAAVVEYLRANGGQERIYGKDDVILRRGDPGRAFFVVLSGEVEVRLADVDNRTLPLTRMGPGASFGEMALLRNQDVSADVVALSEVTVLAYPGDRFQEALAECGPLRDRLMNRLADNLQQTTAEAWEFFQRAEALQALTRTEDHPSTMVANSAKLKGIGKKLTTISEAGGPVVISGDPGTGKLLAARMVHGGRDITEPMIVVDCRRLEPHEARKLIFGTTQVGSIGDSSSGFGAVHLSHGGTLVLHHGDALDPEIQDRFARFLTPDAETPSFPRVRLVVTCRSIDNQPEDGLVTQAMNGGHHVRMPRLAECRKDIVPLARHFLDECTGAQGSDLSITARHAVVSLRYRHRNMAELKETIQLAALCADGDEIRAEHIFTAPGEGTAPTGFNLGEVGFLRRVVLGKPLILARSVVFVSFLVIIALCLIFPATMAGRAANTLIWNAWEPIVFGLFLLVGRIWCTICPLSVAGRLAQRLGTLGKPPPSWLENSWVWIATFGFLAIVWSERVFHMTDRPFPSGILLLTLITLPIVFTLIYQRETWCRYACPLGTLGAALTPPSPLHLEANSSVCASSCTTHDCFKGSKTLDIPGCTVFHHPLNGSESHMCKLCMDCLKSCPHQSARVYAQPPLVGVWHLGTAAWALAPFLLAVFLLSPVLLAIQADPSLSGFLAVTVGGVLAVVVGALLTRVLPSLITGGDGEDSAIPTQVAFALMVLAWGPLMAYQFGNISALSAFQLSSNPPSLLGQLVGTNNLTLLPVAQIIIIVFAAAMAAIILWRISVHAHNDEEHIAWGGWFLVMAGCLAYVVICLTIVVRA